MKFRSSIVSMSSLVYIFKILSKVGNAQGLSSADIVQQSDGNAAAEIDLQEKQISQISLIFKSKIEPWIWVEEVGEF